MLVGLLGRRVAGERAGLIAAAVAAVHPLLWLADGALMSESLYGPFVVAALLAACAYVGARTAARAALVGALVGLAALTRGEALLLVPLLALATLVRAPLPGRARLAHLGALVAAFAVVLAPWSIRNALTFDAPVLISANADGVWAGANCEPTYYGPIVGSWDFPATAGGRRATRPSSRRSTAAAGSRTCARTPGACRSSSPRASAGSGTCTARTRTASSRRARAVRPAPSGSASCCTGCSCPSPWPARGCSARAAHVLAILLAPAAMVTVTALLSYGGTRFRFAAEPSIVVLAAVAADALLRRGRRPAR